MYLKQINIENYGAIEKLNITTKFNETGNPKPIILVGKNGSGKTLLLANIADSLIEAKRKCYSKLQETDIDKYFKLGKKDYIFSGNDYSYINLEYQIEEIINKYTDFVTTLGKNDFNEKYNEIDFDGLTKSNPDFLESGYFKEFHSSNNEKLKSDFEKNTYIYFPHSRYDIPAWLNEVEIGFDFSSKFVGESSSNILKSYIIPEIQKWILDVILDRELYEKPLLPFSDLLKLPRYSSIQNPNNIEFNVSFPVNGNNTTTHNLINDILSVIYRAKSFSSESARIGISKKSFRRIEIIVTEKDKGEFTVAPSFSHLSSGEIMLLSIFASILKDFNTLNPNNPTQNLSDVSGIVLIDEIDLHLHLSFQRKVLPKLIALFPKIQFIVTTHSPFFLLGMKEKFGENYQLVNLPDGIELSIDDFSEYKEAFDAFISLNENYRTEFRQIREKLSQINKPLIITEGKTDWQHLKMALKKLQTSGKFGSLDIEFYDYGDEVKMCDSELATICQKLSKVPNQKKTICIFDRDNPSYLKMTDDSVGYKFHSNNVYSFCIPVPSHRVNHKRISIEHYYTDEAITTFDENDRRLFLSSEFLPKSGQHKSKPNIVYGKRKDIKDCTEENMAKILDNDVIEVSNESEKNIALSKAAFAQNIMEEREKFNAFDISKFEEIFSIIEKILQV